MRQGAFAHICLLKTGVVSVIVQEKNTRKHKENDNGRDTYEGGGLCGDHFDGILAEKKRIF